MRLVLRVRSTVDRTAAIAMATLLCVLATTPARSQSAFLGRAEITLYGIGLKADPAVQTVPKGFATIVSTFLQGPTQPDALPPFAPDAEVRATLSGPSFPAPIELTTKPNSPFNIPILTVAGTHMLENIRLVSGGEVLLYATPETAKIEVIDKLLVTTVTARPLTADEIREKGIVFDKSNFQAYNFTAAFAIDDGSKINIAFPVVLPTIKGPDDASVSVAGLSSVDAPQLKSLQTLIPDTLQIQARIPNLSVVGFAITLDDAPASQNFFVPPIPGVIVIPGDIGFLNQFFSVMLMVANVAPGDSNLVVSDLTASIVLPPGKDNVVGSADDPLAMAQRAGGEAARIVPVTQAGPDGALGTSDDITTVGPGESGNAEFLVEGRREGTHIVEMELSGTLHGLPIGPVPVHGRAAGAVLVRNPTFTLTFVHPQVVNAGEAYTLDVGVTNTSASPANFVSVNLFAANITGAQLADEPVKDVESIAPGDTKTVSFRLVSKRSGKITAATLDSDDQVNGRFLLKTAVGELDVPLSPDSLILPTEAHGLPQPLPDATVGLLTRAWAVATAPPAALPKDLSRFSKQLVIDRGVQTAEAGFRVTLGEPLPRAVSDLLFDFLGSEYLDLSSRVPAGDTTGLLGLLQRDVTGFDLLRRRSVRGDAFADAIGRILATQAASGGVAFHSALAEQLTSRAGHVSFLISSPNGVPVDGVLVDAGGLATGGVDGTGKAKKEIPFSDVVNIRNDAGILIGQLFVVAVPTASKYTLHLTRRADNDPSTYDLSVAYPAAGGGLKFASWTSLGPTDVPQLRQNSDETPRLEIQLDSVEGVVAARQATPTSVNDPPPALLGAVQIANADMVGCDDHMVPGGRVVAVLFSEQVTPESVQNKLAAAEITAFQPEANRVLSVALQPGGRMAFVALAKPVGPFVPRSMTVTGVSDRSGHAMTGAGTVPIVTTVPADAGRVSGKILNADGTPASGADVRLFCEFACFGGETETFGIAQQFAGADGSYSIDYVANAAAATIKLIAIDPNTDELRTVRFRFARSGQQLNVDVVLLGRGTYRGRTLAEDGKTPLPGTSVRITSTTDQSQYGVVTDTEGAFEIPRVPVGNVLVEAVNATRPAQLFVSDNIPFAGAVVTRDLTLLDVNTTVHVNHGTISGRVVRADGVTAVAGVPVIAYYTSRSQATVKCSPPPGAGGDEPGECALAVMTSDANGLFGFQSLPSGQYRLNTFEQASLQEGNVQLTVAVDKTVEVSVLLGGGFGTVKGVVLDAAGHPVADAVVGGGLSLVNVNAADGTFTMTDVPVGRRQILAVSQALQSTGETTIDIVAPGETVNATVVLKPVGAVAGVVRSRDGVPQAAVKVWVFTDCFDELGQKSICIQGEATTGADGGYRIGKLGIGQYRVSAFRGDLKDGNIVPIAIRYNNQVLVADITYRGGFGTVAGRVLRAESCPTPPCAETPLPARVSISGDRLVVAGGQVGVKFEYVQNFSVKDNDFSTGAYEFDGVWVGPFTVRAAGQFSPEPIAAAGTIPAPGATVTADLRLQPTSRLTGTVLESDGFTPVTNRQISLKFHSNSVVVFCSEDEFGFGDCQTIPQGVQEAFAATDAQGHFAFPLVNAGPFTLTATDVATGKVATIKGSVRAGETVDLPMRLLGRSRVTVRTFRSDGVTPVTGANVSLQQIDYPQEQRTGVAANGTIVFEGGDALSEGAFVVTSIGPGGFAGRASGAVTADNQNVTVDVFLFDATGTVNGQVLRTNPLGALVQVPNAEVVLFNASGPIAFAVSDAQGAFSIPLVPTGPFTVESFDAVTAGRGRAQGVVLGGNVATSVTVRLESLASVRGTVVQSGSLAPLKGWTVALDQTTASGRGLPQQVTQTGVDGSFSFPGASVGSYRLSAFKSGVVGNAAVNGQIAQAGQLIEVPIVVEIVRRVTGRVAGIVVSGTGTPAPSAQVEVCGSGDPCRPVVGGLDGRFALDDVPLGRFIVRATAQVTGNPSVGTSGGTLLFEGDVADVSIALLGLSTIEGTVFETINNAQVPAANASVQLIGQPGSGCPGACQQSTDAAGQFRFVNVPAQTFTLVASNLGGQRGSIGDVLTPGQLKTGLQIVLAPAVTLHGRVLLENGTPAGGVVAELAVTNGRLFAETAVDGTFTFDAVSVGAYALSLQDPIGGGLAKRKGTITTTQAIDLGDMTLDTTAPAVAASSPPNGGLNVPLVPEIRVTFTEPLDASTVSDVNMTLVGPAGPISGRVDLIENDTVARFRLLPGDSLASVAKYSIRISGVKDRVGRRMPADYTGSFTTVDTVPPTILETVPAASATGVSVDSVVRIKFSEIVDPSKFAAAPIRLTGPAGDVAGRIDYLFNNSVVVFTPSRPLSDDTAYTVDVSAATDLAGLTQAAPARFGFSTTDRTPPAITSLTASGNGRVIQHAVAKVTATTNTTDVAVVDFFLNDVFAFAARVAPYSMSFQATPSLAAAGGQIKVSAVATDTSGNRSVLPAVLMVPVDPDRAPSIAIESPAAGLTAGAGERVTVRVHAVDDIGVAEMSYSAKALAVIDVATRTIAPAAADRAEEFGFNVPADAVPGTTITLQASARDTQGQLAEALPVTIRVRDSVGPTVQITGVSSGQRVVPGTTVKAIVSASDPSGIAEIGFAVSGATTRGEQRQVSPVQSPVATSFEFTVPANAASTDKVFLDAFAVDSAGNRSDAARLILPVADRRAPTVTLRTTSGSLTMVPGGTVSIQVDAVDDLALANLQLTATGALTFAETRSLAVPAASASATFVVNVPAGIVSGATATFSALALDASGNSSVPVTLVLTARTTSGLTMPASLLLLAGQTAPLPMTLDAPAPAGGVKVDLVSSAPATATVTPSLVFAEGELQKSATVSTTAGGAAQIDASIGGVTRATTTVTVSGGVVRGTVVTAAPGGFVAVPNAQVTVFHAGTPLTTIADSDGAFLVTGVQGVAFSVSATDGTLLGFVDDTLNAPNGSATTTVILLPVGALAGTVTLADGATPAGANVKVDLFEASAANVSIATTFTDASGQWRFPLVSPGAYILDASDANGNRGRSSATVNATGAEVTVPIAFLGRGMVIVKVTSGAGAAVANANVEFNASSLFGPASARTGTTNAQGQVTFSGVFVGSVSAGAKDPVTNQAGSTSGQLTSNGETVTLAVQLSAFGNLQGTVLRADGTTHVPNATVRVTCAGNGCQFQTTTDVNGFYAFSFLPFTAFNVRVTDPGTRGIGVSSGAFATSGETLTRDVSLLPQGALLVTVADADGQPIDGAAVTAVVTSGQIQDQLSGVTGVVSGTGGRVLLDRLLAGSVVVTATLNGLAGQASGLVFADQVTPIQVQLEARGSMTATVFEPDGQTPAAGFVRFTRTANGSIVDVPLANGSATASNLRLGVYRVEAYDAQSRLRAQQNGITLSANGEQAAATLVLVGLGTINGRVLHPTGGDAGNLFVSLQSLNPSFGGFYGATTDAAGNYQVTGVPVGSVRATSSKPAEQLIGEASGVLAQHGQTLTLDVLLETNAVNLPVTYADVNDSSYSIAANGGLVGGTANVFIFGATNLDLILNGTPVAFTGSSFGASENAGREIAIRQSGLHGLNVTRKTFVPSDGYFARQLEILTNPTDQPITVDVRVSSRLYGRTNRFGFTNQHFVAGTSSGDSTLSVANPQTADRWVLLNSGGSDPYYNFESGQPLAFVFDGDGAPVHAGTATFNYTNPYSNLVYAWPSVTVPAGGTIALMHVVSESPTYNGTLAAAQRLLQMPPELLAGLSVDELSQVANFVLPASGVSTVTPLPPVNGSLSGRVLEGDGLTGVPGAQVRFWSHNQIYSRMWFYSVDGAGNFSFTGGVRHPLPLGEYELTAQHPNGQFNFAPTAVYTFGPGETAGAHDIVFSDSGILKGVVKRQNGVPVPDAFLTVAFFVSQTTDASGRYVFTGVHSGTPQISGTVQHPQGSPLQIGPVNLTLAGGQVRDDVLFVEPTGTVTGTLRDADGNVQPGRLVTLHNANSSFVRQTNTDSGGRFTFTDVRLGDMTVESNDPISGFPVKVTVPVAQDQVRDITLSYVGKGSLTVTITRSTGAILPGMTVQLSGPTFNTQTLASKADGTAGPFVSVPFGVAMTITVSHPQQSSALRASKTYTISSASEATTLAMPPFATVSALIRKPNGTLAGAGVPVSLSGSGFFASGSTDVNSAIALGPVPLASKFRVDVSHPTTNINFQRPYVRLDNLIAAADNQLLALDTHYPAIARLAITVQSAPGAPIGGARVQSYDTLATNFQDRGNTDSSGFLQVAQVPEGAFGVRVYQPGSSTNVIELVTGQVQAADDGGTVPVTITPKAFSVTVRGVTTEANGTTPIKGYQIRLLRAIDRVQLQTTCPGGSSVCFPGNSLPAGRFEFPVTTSTGAGFIVQTFSPVGDGQTFEQTVMPTSDGAIDVTMTLPFYTATLTGTVFASDGTTPVGGGTIFPVTATGRSFLGTIVPDSGVYNFAPNLYPTEGMKIQVSYTGIQTIEVPIGPITQSGQTITTNVTLPPSLVTKVRGSVVAGDGVTPLPNVWVEVFLGEPGCTNCTGLTSFGADSIGGFEFRAALPADGKFFVRAHSPVTDSIIGEKAGVAAVQNGTIDLGAISVPISIVRGQVTFGASQPTPFATVIATLPDTSSRFATADQDGRFLFYEIPVGASTITAQDPESAVSGSAPVTVPSNTSAVDVHVQLPEVATIRVRVLDRLGAPTEQASVALFQKDGSFEQIRLPAQTEDGFYTFPALALGTYSLQASLNACDENGENCELLFTTGEVTAQQSGTTEKTLDFFSLGRALLFITDGFGKPVAQQTVQATFQSTPVVGPLGRYRATVTLTTDDNGFAFFDRVAAGRYVVVVKTQADERGVGTASATVAPADFDVAAITIGANVVELGDNGTTVLGFDEFVFVIAGGGQAIEGGRMDNGQFVEGGAFSSALSLRLLGETQCCALAGNIEDDNGDRTLTLTPFAPARPFGLVVTRKLFAPPDGRFARYLDTFVNTTMSPMTVSMQWWTTPNHSTQFVADVTPSQDDGGYVVRADADQQSSAFGVVFAGIDPPAAPGLTYPDDYSFFLTTSTITLAPGQSASLLNFLIVRRPSDDVLGQVDSLKNLSDPSALTGLSDEERAAIVNFRVPPR